MVIPNSAPLGNGSASVRRRRGVLSAELAVAIAILVTGLFPLGVTVFKDQKRARALYIQAIAMEIVDGEMEMLAAGGWRNVRTGESPCSVHTRSAENLPAGRFTLTRDASSIRLEWTPDNRGFGGAVRRRLPLPKTP